MKKAIKLVSLIIATVIIAVTFGGCSLIDSIFNAKTRPKMDFGTNTANSAVFLIDGQKNSGSGSNRTFDFSGDHTAYFLNVDYTGTYYANISNTVISSDKGKCGYSVAKLLDGEGNTVCTVDVVIAYGEKKAYLVKTLNDGTEGIIYQCEIKDEMITLDKMFTFTAEYDNGVVSAWVDDTMLFGESADLSKLGMKSEPYCAFFSKDCSVQFKYIKTYGDLAIKEFDPKSLYEGCENLALNCGYTAYRGSQDCFELSSGTIKKLRNAKAGGVRITGVNFNDGDSAVLKYTVTTHVARKNWQGARMGFLVDGDGNEIKIYSLENSYGIYKGEEGLGGASINRVIDQAYEVMAYYSHGYVWLWIDGELLIDSLQLPKGTTYRPDFFAFFEFGEVDITDYFICHPNDVEIW